MSTERNRIYLQHPTKENELLPAQLLKESDGLISMRLLEELTLPANSESKQFFHDQHDLFYGFSCQILRMESSGPNPVVSVKQIGPKERHEQRESFRLPVYDDSVTATVNDQFEAAVFDMSYGGIAVVLEYGGFTDETWLKIDLVFDCVTVTGQMQIRNRKLLNDGRYRYGLAADMANKEFLGELERIVQTLQNVKARRASRLGTNNRYQPGINYDFGEDKEEAKKKEAEKVAAEEAANSSNKRDRRMHDRKSWAGPAKVYILEERQLRVLEVSTMDLSQGGLCFVCKPYIYAGTELLFEKQGPGGLFRVCSRVQNVDLNGDGMHRVGVQFVGAPLKPGETHEKYYMV